jgi:hypothetical protein
MRCGGDGERRNQTASSRWSASMDTSVGSRSARVRGLRMRWTGRMRLPCELLLYSIPDDFQSGNASRALERRALVLPERRVRSRNVRCDRSSSGFVEPSTGRGCFGVFLQSLEHDVSMQFELASGSGCPGTALSAGDVVRATLVDASGNLLLDKTYTLEFQGDNSRGAPFRRDSRRRC